MNIVNQYIDYIRNVRRYSDRTVELYSQAIMDFASVSGAESDSGLIAALNLSEIRSYEVILIDQRKMSAKTVNLYLSSLSGFCRFLIKKGLLESNPVTLVARPKNAKLLPAYYTQDSMASYFAQTDYCASVEDLEAFVQAPFSESGEAAYKKRLARLIISMLYTLGIRRSELVSLTVGSVDFGRKIVKIYGKGDKMREIPLLALLSEEILLYLKAVETMCGGKRSLKEPLFVTYKGTQLYPAYVDRAVKSALGGQKNIRGRKSPHVLRHSLATELMNEDTALNSIKELLGHSSLAATQVYTHSSVARLKDSYERAHPRAKNGGKHGD